jgi:hypothetical protein
LLIGQLTVGIGRGHQDVGIIGADAIDDQARLAVPRHNGSRIDSGLSQIQTEPRFAMVLVLAMTIETILRQDGANIAVERNISRRR